ncbi:MAG: CDP-alcohol phosphatidyltransferase family protein [Saprospiraceae bacterium]|nr:CDP-alcohol phosphatidyltransferase family protein [Saprospiraceae bacterium]MBP9744116.1 CDP-alcohol phosphatidyltransferase family protein [Saprospiraceae bacterium]
MNRVIHKKSWYLINGITLYRIFAAPFLLILILNGRLDVFKWLLGLSFFTDLIDGYLARKYQVTSMLGARLDSIGDDLTVLVAMIALLVTQPAFIKQQIVIFIILLALFLIQAIYAFIRYGKFTSFHTYLAKAAALLQGLFFLAFFFLDRPNMVLFYVAALVTMLELIEETILVGMVKEWQTNVHGVWWWLKGR